MMKTTKLLLLSVASVATLAAGSALAQAKKAAAPAAAAPAPAAAAAPAAAPVVLTANVPGICVLQREVLIGASDVGKSVQARLTQLQSQVQAELTGEGTSLQNDAKALDTKQSTLAATAYQQQRAALEQRAQALQMKQDQRNQELEATRQKALLRVWNEAVPLVGDIIKQKNCAILLDGAAVMAVNNAMDLTPAAVTALNGKIKEITFDRERLQAQQ